MLSFYRVFYLELILYAIYSIVNSFISNLQDIFIFMRNNFLFFQEIDQKRIFYLFIL